MTHLAPPADVALAYAETRQRIIELLRSASADDGARSVPACPGWTVADLAAHVAGLAEDVLAGRVEGAGSDAWTAAQVDRHRGDTLEQLADALDATAAGFDAALPHIPAPVNSQIVMDTVTHEHDLRAALGKPGARDSLAVTVGLGYLLEGRAATNPASVESMLALNITSWDLMRSLSGRRSRDQLSALGLDADVVISAMAGSPVTAPSAPVE